MVNIVSNIKASDCPNADEGYDSDFHDDDFHQWTVTVDTLSVADDPDVRLSETTEQFPEWLRYKKTMQRGADEAARIAIEAPVMGWAMAALDELEREAKLNDAIGRELSGQV
ncbi:hypothetical protein ABIA16_003546 [Sinorhizobium fredii]